MQYNAIQWDHGTTNQIIQVTIFKKSEFQEPKYPERPSTAAKSIVIANLISVIAILKTRLKNLHKNR